MMSRCRKDNGFTLAELLVAATLLSLVMASVYTLFSSTMRTWRRSEGAFDMHQVARTALAVFEREVENLMDEAGYLFTGEDDEVTMFVVAEPMDVEEAEGPHLMRVRYRFDRTGEELVREEALVEMALPNRPPDGKPVEPGKIKLKRKREFVIATHVRDFELRYYWIPAPDQRYENEPPQPTEHLVVDSHEEGWGLPQAIEARLTLTDPENPDREISFDVLRTLHTRTFYYPLRDLEKMLGDLI
ncbi:MAG: prepilin-type N-terminal cleavage/methylation domain-containing protein [Candidatus Hydrogenedentes bacterium]|nr:prepilin-type N-terminal cleavage/methylation domain-containing protein [Candidatus Hydrogenedentota bacterium]